MNACAIPETACCPARAPVVPAAIVEKTAVPIEPPISWPVEFRPEIIQKARTTDVTFWRVRGERSLQRSMTSRRSSTDTSIGSV